MTQQELTLLEEVVAIAFRPLVRQRAQTLLLLHEGYQPGQVAEVLTSWRSRSWR